MSFRLAVPSDLRGAVDATVSAQNGNLVVAPDLPIAPTITVFCDPRIDVQSVGASPTAGGFSVRASGQLN